MSTIIQRPFPSRVETSEPGLPDEADRVIRCLPQGICSWNYWLNHNGKQDAVIMNCGFRGSGKLIIEGSTLDMKKRGFFQTSWQVQYEGQELMSASRPNILSSQTTVEDPYGEWTLRRISCFQRAMSVSQNELTFATIRPDHCFTRRATIEVLRPEIQYPTLVFCFWLAAHGWMADSQSG